MIQTAQFTNPFVGLRAFEESEDYLFFGRGKQINELLKKLNTSRFLAVIGSSGSGKSSLVKSGLMPAIYSGFMSVGCNWRVAMLRPGNDPIGNMTRELAREGVLYENIAASEIPYVPIIESTLRRSAGGLVQVYKQAHLPETENLIVVIDQFEELFRFSKYEKDAKEGKSDALNFINLLLTASQQRDFPVYVLLTMRSDFLGDCAQFRGLPEAINAGQYLVPRMTRDEIREAITGPIAVGGAQISQRLLTRLLNDVGNNTDQLPILQHAMMRTWDAWLKKNKPEITIDLDDYEKIGTMSSALSQHAEEAYSELKTEKQRMICELMFKALTDKAADVRGTRRPTSVADLCLLTGATAQEVIDVVEVFRKKGRTFLMPPPGVPLDAQCVIDISHESIMRVWTRLIKWTDEETLSAEIYIRLSEAANLNKQGEAGLWRNPQLQIGLRWLENNKPNETWAKRYNADFETAITFLKKSEEEYLLEQEEKERILRKEKGKRRANMIGLLIITIVAIAGLIIVKDSEIRAKDSENRAKDSENRANANRDTALKYETMAKDSANSARVNEVKATRNQLDALVSQLSAIENKNKAKEAEKKAIAERETAKAERAKAETAKAIALEQNKQIAATEYLRLIREGPTDKSIILKDSFDVKLIAYCNHLDSLHAERKNDELYEKLYFCLAAKDKDNIAIDRDTKGDIILEGIFSKNNSLGNNYGVSVSGDKHKLIVSYKGAPVDSAELSDRSRDTVTFLSVDTTDHLVIASCEYNTIWIVNYEGDKKKILHKDAIPLGSKATAIDYDNKNDVIYFGLKNGEIGYILYHKDKKNQPIYENNLGSLITAIDFFSDSATKIYYLLATTIKGKAAVYQLDSVSKGGAKYLNPDEKLSGNMLPKNLGEIKSARYAGNHKVELLISRRNSSFNDIYIWDPFVNDLLARYKEVLNNDPRKSFLDGISKTCKFY